MTTTVLLIRHGQTNSNTSGYYMGWSEEDLNDTGYTQVHRLSSRLASLPIDSVYVSPLRRTCTTAAILAEPHGLEPKVLDDLIEIKQGDWQGRHMDEIKEKWPELWRQSRTDPSKFTMPNGESFQQVSERAARAYESIAAANQGKLAVIVTHEVVVKVLVTHVLGTTNSVYRRFNIDNASLSMIRIDNGNARLITLNDISHLDNFERG